VPPWKLEVGPPLPIRSHGEPLSGPPHHGAVQEWWPTMSRIDDDGA
jgi:hypothetical protein